MDGKTTGIFGNRHVLRDLVRPPGSPERRRVLILLGGGQSGIVSAERLSVLSQMGIHADAFDLIVGISAGAYNALGFASRQTDLMREVYHWVCETPVVSRMYLLVSEVEKRFDRARFEACPSEILIGISDEDGGLSLPSAKNEPHLFGLLYAASAIPPFSSGLSPGGKPAFDGAFAHPCPVSQVLLKATRSWDDAYGVDILLLANRPRPLDLPWYDPWLYWWGVNTVLRFWAPGLCRGAHEVDARVEASIPMFEKQRRSLRFRTCAWFPTIGEYIFPLEWSSATLRRVGAAVRAETESTLALC